MKASDKTLLENFKTHFSSKNEDAMAGNFFNKNQQKYLEYSDMAFGINIF